MSRPDGCTAIVTGAARGMGKAIAARLAAEGWPVAGFDLNGDAMKQTAEEIGPSVLGLAVDITDYNQVTAAVDDVQRALGPVGLLVNNAGLWVTKPFAESTPADWVPDFAVNLHGTLHCTRAVIGGMIEAGWGRVVNVISDAGRVGVASQATYSAAKAAVAGFARALAKEVGPRGVTVNCISMGPTLTPATSDFLQGDALERRKKATPLRRLGEPGDAAAAVSYLAGDGASWVTGQTLSINGGMNMLP